MAYGDRYSQARQFGPLSVFGISLASASGIAAAVIVDLMQQREASALFVLNRYLADLTSMLGLQTLPLYGVMLALMGLGAGSVFFLQPATLRGAFIQGFGLLATVLTVAPSDLGAPLDAPSTQPAMLSSQTGVIAAQAAGAKPIPVSTAQSQQDFDVRYQLRIQIRFPDGLENDWETMLRRRQLTGKLFNPDTGFRYDLFRNSGAELSFEDNVLRIRTDVRGVDDEAELRLLVETRGYAILEDSFEAQAGPNRIWSVTMEPSSMPLVVQRLRHTYSF
ncbi:MAG: hypothetical protein V2I43_05175 [Parvularcula sp.]|jgi:hypothetical protein|nr:hypothetical protein [Parvularcula sp.]